MKQLLNITLLVCTAGSIAVSQPHIAENGPASANITIAVTLPSRTKIMSATRIAPIVITRADIQNGSKVIPAAAALTIWSNARNGYVLRSRLVSLKAGDGSDAAGIMILGRVTGTRDHQPQGVDSRDLYQGAKTEKNLTGLTVDLKLLLDPGTKPGQYQYESEFSVSCL